jgi:hypothetical protein
MRVTGLMLSPSLGAARLAWQIGPPVCLCGGPPAVDRPPSQCAAPPASCPLCHALDPGQASPTGSLTRQRNRYSSSSSPQAGLHRRPPRHQRQLALGLLRRCALQVRQDLRNELRLLDAGDDLELSTTARAALDLYAEHSLQPSRPAHRHMPWRRRLGRFSARYQRLRRTPAPMRRRHRPPILTVRDVDVAGRDGVELIWLPPRSPNLNAFAERFVRAVS